MVEYHCESLVSVQCIDYSKQLLSEGIKECYKKIIMDYTEIIDWLNSNNNNVVERSPLHYKLFLENIIAVGVGSYVVDISIVMELLEEECEMNPDFTEYFKQLSYSTVEHVIHLVSNHVNSYVDRDVETQVILGGWVADTVFIIYFKEEEDYGAYNLQQPFI